MLTKEEGENQIIFDLSIQKAKKWLRDGILSQEEFRCFEEKMREKYKPFFQFSVASGFLT